MPQKKVQTATTRTWLTRTLSAVGVILLAAVPALGLSLLSPGLKSPLATRTNVSSSNADVSVSFAPFALDAPTTTVRLTKAVDPGSPPQEHNKRVSLFSPNTSAELRPQASRTAGARDAKTEVAGLSDSGSIRALLLPVAGQQSPTTTSPKLAAPSARKVDGSVAAGDRTSATPAGEVASSSAQDPVVSSGRRTFLTSTQPETVTVLVPKFSQGRTRGASGAGQAPTASLASDNQRLNPLESDLDTRFMRTSRPNKTTPFQ